MKRGKSWQKSEMKGVWEKKKRLEILSMDT
jgi:hypothetical protein